MVKRDEASEAQEGHETETRAQGTGGASEARSGARGAGGADVGTGQVREALEAEQAQGFRGTAVDPTPNEAYTVAGVTSGQPTPETDPDHARKVRDELEERRSRR